MVTAFILLIPLLGNAFVEGWNWPLSGFLLAGTLLFAAALTYEVVAGKMESRAYRLAVGLAVGTAFILSWVSMVRVSESENPANLMYYAVPGVGVIGACLARFRARGMARALFATALAQVLVPLILLVVWRTGPEPGVAMRFGGSGFFAMLFVASAVLFRQAARGEPEPGLA